LVHQSLIYPSLTWSYRPPIGPHRQLVATHLHPKALRRMCQRYLPPLLHQQVPQTSKTTTTTTARGQVPCSEHLRAHPQCLTAWSPRRFLLTPDTAQHRCPPHSHDPHLPDLFLRPVRLCGPSEHAHHRRSSSSTCRRYTTKTRTRRPHLVYRARAPLLPRRTVCSGSLAG